MPKADIIRVFRAHILHPGPNKTKQKKKANPNNPKKKKKKGGARQSYLVAQSQVFIS